MCIWENNVECNQRSKFTLLKNAIVTYLPLWAEELLQLVPLLHYLVQGGPGLGLEARARARASARATLLSVQVTLMWGDYL